MSDDAKRWADMQRAYFDAEERSKQAGTQRALGRRVVQLVARPGLVADGYTWNPMTIALCADGTMWMLTHDASAWHRLPDVNDEE